MLFLTQGVSNGIRQAFLMAQLQLALAFPFVKTNAMSYLSRAFDFSRQFLFKWTVNWRFIGEQVFSSKEFSTTLLIGHVTVLAIFALTRWLKPASRSMMDMIKKVANFSEPLGDIQQETARRVAPQFVMTTILTANVIGMLFARSLHYQFYAYLAWSTPFLLWKSGMHPFLQYGVWLAQEWAWNVFPSTGLSSQVVVGTMVITIISVWVGSRNEEFTKIKTAGQSERK